MWNLMLTDPVDASHKVTASCTMTNAIYFCGTNTPISRFFYIFLHSSTSLPSSSILHHPTITPLTIPQYISYFYLITLHNRQTNTWQSFPGPQRSQ